VKDVEAVDTAAVREKYWDSQWYLDFKDDLNRISVDDDRKRDKRDS